MLLPTKGKQSGFRLPQKAFGEGEGIRLGQINGNTLSVRGVRCARRIRSLVQMKVELKAHAELACLLCNAIYDRDHEWRFTPNSLAA